MVHLYNCCVFGYCLGSYFYFKHNFILHLKRKFSEIGFCLRAQVEPTQLAPNDTASPCLCPKIVTSSIYWTQLNKFHLNTEIESNVRNVVFEIKIEGWTMSRNTVVV
jgi:hypothetical protein